MPDRSCDAIEELKCEITRLETLVDMNLLWAKPGDEWYISIYKPVAGYKAVMYGPEGPEQTGMTGYITPWLAYQEALDWCLNERVKILKQEILICDACGGWQINGHCDTCYSRSLRERFRNGRMGCG